MATHPVQVVLPIVLTAAERASIVLTSNRAVSKWPDIFGEPLLASAALDRLTHRAHFVEITGASYRAEHGSE
jgi:DNA replication protein DnaC